MQMHQLDARIRKMLQVIEEYKVRVSTPVAGIEIAPRGSEEFKPFVNGSEWGGTPDTQWMDFRFQVTIPEGYRGQAVLSVRTGREGLWEAVNPQFVVWVNGRIEQAFDSKHTTLVLDDTAQPGKTYDVYLQAYNSIEQGAYFVGGTAPRLYVNVDDVCDDVVQLHYDINVPWQAALLVTEGTREREQTLYKLSDALNLLDLRNPFSPEFHASVQAARDFMSRNYYEPLKNAVPEAYANAVGHTHIDVAWLWDLYQTRHKAVRSFATMLKLMERYPDFKFMSSQPQLYQFVKEDQPELFERIKEAVKRGQWEVEGGMWVEADCNLSGGEALVRQFLYGNEFFETEFGQRSKILWLPDVFGYSAALPQILKKSGIDYFMTSKLSWSEFNLSPYDTFTWKGIDGSEVLTHFTPSRDYSGTGTYESHADLAFFTTYNAMINPSQIKGGWQRFQQKGLDNEFLVSYGFGDGGGGSTDWMIENARRMSVPVAGAPVVRQEFARDFFTKLEARVKDNPRLPKWSGELYLEYHRGTYTSMAQNKRYNRKIEIALREVELWSEYATRLTGCEYPNDELRQIWREVLTEQFHDILPGSSIQKVYEDSKEIYERLFKQLDVLREKALGTLASSLKGDILFFNSLSSERDDIVWFEAPEGTNSLVDGQGNRFAVQRVGDRCCAFVEGLKPMTATPMCFSAETVETEKPVVTGAGFETPFFKGTFDGAMRITSLVDKRNGREIAKQGKALNRIVCYENRPHNYDAWDINIYYDERQWEVDDVQSVELIADGPVLSKLRVTYGFNNSTIQQDLVFYSAIDRIDFENVVDWKEQHYLLKAHFPVDVFYNEATYDIQYGNVRRATHKNTSWDVARFEVCAHKWIDVSEPGYGVSLLNDCKYGYSVDENSMAITMLKSATSPNPTADQCVHTFTYSLLPHLGDWRTAATPEMAYMLNIPVIAVKGQGGKGELESFASVDAENVMIESVKHELHGERTVIRLYECYGERSEVTLKLGQAPKALKLATLMEDDLDTVLTDGDSYTFEIKPYEIVTFIAE